jgi:exosome complex component RRP43
MATSTVLDVPSTSKNTETNETLALRASTFRRLHPRAYLERFLAERVRPDGREPLTFRDVSLNVGASAIH